MSAFFFMIRRLQLPALIEWLEYIVLRFKPWTLYKYCRNPKPVHISGILPDVMHLSHLAICTDASISVLLDLTDDFQKRDSELDNENYRQWCESQRNSAKLH